MSYKNLIPPQTDNVLCHFEKQNIYIMDNHRLALWCWINEIDKKDYGKYALIHIDDYFDCGAKETIIEQMMNKLKENGFELFKLADLYNICVEDLIEEQKPIPSNFQEAIMSLRNKGVLSDEERKGLLEFQKICDDYEFLKKL